MPRLMIILMILIYSPFSMAEIRLYACEKDGVSILQDKPIKDCENLQTFTYQSVYKGEKDATLREGEQDFFKEQQAVKDLERQRYTEVDEAVGDSLMIRERDRRRDECYFFKGRIDNALERIESRPEDASQWRELVAGIRNDAPQYQYYCGKSYPNLKLLLKDYY